MEQLTANPRKNLKKSYKKKLRNAGKIPAVVYGKTVESTPIDVDGKEFTQLIRNNGSNAVVKLSWGEEDSTVMVGEVQQDPIKNDILHIDFFEVNMNKKIKVEIPIEWIGEENVSKGDGVLQKQYHSIEVSCLPTQIPDQIQADLSSLEIGDSLTVADLSIDEGIEVLLSDDSVLVSVLAPTLETELEESQTNEDQEPELVDGEAGSDEEEEK